MSRSRAPHRSDGRAAAALLLGQAVAAAGAFAVNLLAARVMDPSGRGDLAFALQLAYFASIFATMGIERPFIPTQSGPFGHQLRQYIRLVAPSAGAVALLTIIVVQFAPLETRTLFAMGVLTACYVVLDAITRGIRVAYISSRRLSPFVINALATQFIILSGALIITSLDVADPAIWLAVYAASGIGSLAILIYILRTTRALPRLNRQVAGHLRRRGVRLLPYAIGNTAMVRSDRLLLPYLGNSADLGLYVTVATVMEMAAWPIQQWVDASLRRWTDKSGTGEFTRWRALVGRAVCLAIAISGVLGVVCYFVVTRLLPTSYHPAITVIVPLGFAGVVYGVTRVLQGILLALGGSSRVSLVELSGTFFSVVSYIVLIPKYGMLGAAFGSTIGYTVCAIVAVGAITYTRSQNVDSHASVGITDGGDAQ